MCKKIPGGVIKALNKYELVYCLRPTLDAESVDKAINVVDSYISNLGGKVAKTDKIGRKKLAYEVDNYRDGIYLTTYFEAPQDKIIELKRNLKLNDNVIRQMVLKTDTFDPPRMERPERPERSDRSERPYRRPVSR